MSSFDPKRTWAAQDFGRQVAEIPKVMDTLTHRLNQEGYSARVYRTNQWPTAAQRIADQYSRGHKVIIVLVGHSLGQVGGWSIASLTWNWLRGDLAEAWREDSTDYATVAMPRENIGEPTK
jgi:hypothetical protein